MENLAILDMVVECKVWGTPMKQYLCKYKNECLFRSSGGQLHLQEDMQHDRTSKCAKRFCCVQGRYRLSPTQVDAAILAHADLPLYLPANRTTFLFTTTNILQSQHP
jgi:hypothetical protein